MDKVGDARVAQDNLIAERFVQPWEQPSSTSIGLAMKARANVKTARLELDSARGALKSAAPAKQEQPGECNPVGRGTPLMTRLHVEEAEDKLVQCTETAIGLMKAVLENVGFARIHSRDRADQQPEPLQNLSNLVKAQLIFYSTAAETSA